MRIAFVVFCTLFVISANAQKEIKLEEAKEQPYIHKPGRILFRKRKDYKPVTFLKNFTASTEDADRKAIYIKSANVIQKLIALRLYEPVPAVYS